MSSQIHISYFFFSAFILSLITVGDILIKFNGPKKLRNFMLLLILANAVQAFVNFLPEKTMAHQIAQITINICRATAILHILSFYHFSKPNKWINLIPFLGIGLLTFTFYFYKHDFDASLHHPGNIILLFHPYYKGLLSNTFLFIFRVSLIISFIFLYLLLAYQLIKKYNGYNNLFAKKLRNWVLLMGITPILFIFQNILFSLNSNLNINQWIVVIISHFNALIFLYRPEFINKAYLKKKLFETNDEKNESFAFNEELFINEFYNKAYFTNPKASLQAFSEIIQVPQNELTRFINLKFSCSFNELIQEKRIALFKDVASKSEYKNYTIEALAKEVGFVSRQSFYIAYKKYNGGIPTDIID
jgi:AraC-like DNA-binding protein